MHDADIVHGDLTTSNLMLSHEGATDVVRIIIARWLAGWLVRMRCASLWSSLTPVTTWVVADGDRLWAGQLAAAAGGQGRGPVRHGARVQQHAHQLGEAGASALCFVPLLFSLEYQCRIRLLFDQTPRWRRCCARTRRAPAARMPPSRSWRKSVSAAASAPWSARELPLSYRRSATDIGHEGAVALAMDRVYCQLLLYQLLHMARAHQESSKRTKYSGRNGACAHSACAIYSQRQIRPITPRAC